MDDPIARHLQQLQDEEDAAALEAADAQEQEVVAGGVDLMKQRLLVEIILPIYSQDLRRLAKPAQPPRPVPAPPVLYRRFAETVMTQTALWMKQNHVDRMKEALDGGVPVEGNMKLGSDARTKLDELFPVPPETPALNAHTVYTEFEARSTLDINNGITYIAERFSAFDNTPITLNWGGTGNNSQIETALKIIPFSPATRFCWLATFIKTRGNFVRFGDARSDKGDTHDSVILSMATWLTNNVAAIHYGGMAAFTAKCTGGTTFAGVRSVANFIKGPAFIESKRLIDTFRKCQQSHSAAARDKKTEASNAMKGNVKNLSEVNQRLEIQNETLREQLEGAQQLLREKEAKIIEQAGYYQQALFYKDQYELLQQQRQQQRPVQMGAAPRQYFPPPPPQQQQQPQQLQQQRRPKNTNHQQNRMQQQQNQNTKSMMVGNNNQQQYQMQQQQQHNQNQNMMIMGTQQNNNQQQLNSGSRRERGEAGTSHLPTFTINGVHLNDGSHTSLTRIVQSVYDEVAALAQDDDDDDAKSWLHGAFKYAFARKKESSIPLFPGDFMGSYSDEKGSHWEIQAGIHNYYNLQKIPVDNEVRKFNTSISFPKGHLIYLYQQSGSQGREKAHLVGARESLWKMSAKYFCVANHEAPPPEQGPRRSFANTAASWEQTAPNNYNNNDNDSSFSSYRNSTNNSNQSHFGFDDEHDYQGSQQQQNDSTTLSTGQEQQYALQQARNTLKETRQQKQQGKAMHP